MIILNLNYLVIQILKIFRQNFEQEYPDYHYDETSVPVSKESEYFTSLFTVPYFETPKKEEKNLSEIDEKKKKRIEYIIEHIKHEDNSLDEVPTNLLNMPAGPNTNIPNTVTTSNALGK